MASYSLSIVTINGNFISNSEFKRTSVWQLNCDELKNVISKSAKRQNNYIQIKFSNGLSAMLYSLGGFMLTVNNDDWESILGNLHAVINFLRTEFACKLFENELTSTSFRISQVRIAIHADLQASTTKLDALKLKNSFSQFKVANFLKIPFQGLSFIYLMDDVKELDGCSHFKFEILQGDFQVGYTNIYTNFKATLSTKYTSCISGMFEATCCFIRHLQDCCIGIQNSL
jgi:hypothetical protein